MGEEVDLPCASPFLVAVEDPDSNQVQEACHGMSLYELRTYMKTRKGSHIMHSIYVYIYIHIYVPMLSIIPQNLSSKQRLKGSPKPIPKSHGPSAQALLLILKILHDLSIL